MKFDLEGDFQMDDDGWDVLEELIEESIKNSTLGINLPDLPFVPGNVILNGIKYVREKEEADEQSIHNNS